MSQETLQNPMNSAENLRGFCADSVKLPRGFRKASVQLFAELQYNFRGACLTFPRNDSSLSADLSLPS